MNKMYINVVHRGDTKSEAKDALRFQQDEAHRLGLRTTILVSAAALLDEELAEYVRGQRERFGDEVGLHLHMWQNPVTAEVAESQERALYLHTRSSKEKILRVAFEQFGEAYGSPPESVGAYILTAPSLRLIRANWPSVTTAITNCFEEGVKMFEGNVRFWYLFSDGGPWGPYWPSRHNNLCPAADESDSVGIVGLPHLNRDMILALTSRDDYFASHPINVVRAKANDGPRAPYCRRFIDQWIRQAEYNGFSYYSLFVSPPWVATEHPFAPDLQANRALYRDSLEWLKRRIDDGRATDMTMSEFGRWYRSNIAVGTPDVNKWDDVLCGTKRQMFWYVDASFRVAFDLNSGGTICDLRPYVGRLERDLGPDTEALWNGNYPFLISSEHRPGSRHGCRVAVNRHSASIGDRRTRCSFSREEDGAWIVTVEPIVLQCGNVSVTVQSVFSFPGDGRILIQRRILDVSGSSPDVAVEEEHVGCWGTTQYPEDMRSSVLRIRNSDGAAVVEIPYTYGTRSESRMDAHEVSADIPTVRTRVRLTSSDKGITATAAEGSLFHPYYTLSIRKELAKGEALNTCLTIEPL